MFINQKKERIKVVAKLQAEKTKIQLENEPEQVFPETGGNGKAERQREKALRERQRAERRRNDREAR